MIGKHHRRRDRPITGSESPAPTNARELVFAVLNQYRRDGGFVAESLNRLCVQHDHRGFAGELVRGAIRRTAALRSLIDPHLKRPRETIEDQLWTILEIGVYQLAFMDGVPAHAAVHETVELTRRIGRPRWTGFANGVLRSVERGLTEQFVDAPAADALPVSHGRYRRLKTPILPDPNNSPAAYFARAFSFPDWLADRWAARYEPRELWRMGHWFNTPGRLFLRVNRLKAAHDDVLAALIDAGVQATAGGEPCSIELADRVDVASLPGFNEGWFAVQDESAMQAAALLDPQPGSRVLDLCAAPGVKTTHLAERMQNTGSVVATDVDPERLRLVEDNCRRLGIEIVEPRGISPASDGLPEGPFDAVLVDAPCTNTGVLGKRPEVRWRLSPRDLDELPVIQKQLLRTACDRVRPGGRVVYSTCSIEPEENERVVRSILEENSAVSLIEERFHGPGQPADGGYLALMTVKP